MKLLVLSCCAPCSCAALKHLADSGTQVTVLFYNPNIFPQREYEKRRDEQQRLCQKLGVAFAELPYDHAAWQAQVRGLEHEPERGKRCSVCFYMRLKRAMQYAKEHGFTAVASVLGVSRYKNLQQVNEAAYKAAKDTGFIYVEIEGRKNGMQDLRQQLIKDLSLYNQNYCGCKPRD